MTIRAALTAILLGVLVVGIPSVGMAQGERGVHDQSYVSPTWGYSVRWYGDEWALTDEASQDGLDSLWLSDAAGNVVGFEGTPGYGGDAMLCLEDLVATVRAIPGATDIVDVRDEQDNLESHWDTRWSWITLLVGLPADGQSIDHVFYLDCRTLAEGEAVLVRILAGPATTFETTRSAVLQATLPRSAWIVDPDSGLLGHGPGLNGQWSRYYDPDCGAFPHMSVRLFASDGAEWGLATMVDGAPDIFAPVSADWTRVLLLENGGATPLTIDPTEFRLAEEVDGNLRDLAPIDATWEDSGEHGERLLAPGTWATLRLELPADVALPLATENSWGAAELVYRDVELRDGEIVLERFGIPGGCGGGSRPRLRLGR